MRHSPPARAGICDDDGGELYQRSDDLPDVVRERLRVYWEQTSPLVEYYTRRGLLVKIDGDQPIDAVTEALCAAIATRCGPC